MSYIHPNSVKIFKCINIWCTFRHTEHMGVEISFRTRHTGLWKVGWKARLVFNFRTRMYIEVTLTPRLIYLLPTQGESPRYPMNKRPGGIHSPSGRLEQRKTSCPFRESINFSSIIHVAGWVMCEMRYCGSRLSHKPTFLWKVNRLKGMGVLKDKIVVTAGHIANPHGFQTAWRWVNLNYLRLSRL